MAESKQFGSPKILQFGDKTGGNLSGESGHCAQCEAMLTDALDGTLSAADQALFDDHMAQCGLCSELLADARRGAAWLEMLRDPKPEPPSALLERILMQTSGVLPAGAQAGQAFPAAMAQPEEFGGAVVAPGYAAPAAYGNVVPFRQRMTAAVRRNPFGHIVFQPRLAMTAAMAFFSIALTLDLTGVRLQDFRASDLKPSSLKRDYYSANARVVQYYEGLRVVYELESRVHDLQSVSEGDAAAGSQGTPQSTTPAQQANPDQPNGEAPAARPEQKSKKPAGPASGPASGPAFGPQKNPGTSRRESPGQPVLSLAEVTAADDPRTGLNMVEAINIIEAGNTEAIHNDAGNADSSNTEVEGTLV